MCKKYPEHKSIDVIVSKVWIIGRSYAAAIERRKPKANDTNDDFYLDKVGPQIMASKIDNWINEAKMSREYGKCIEVHKKVMDLFYSISGQDKRSLASKYLHFHIKEKFYIYDTRAVSALTKLVHYLGIKRGNLLESDEYDHEYHKHYVKCIKVINSIKKIYDIRLSARQLDNLLLKISSDPTILEK